MSINDSGFFQITNYGLFIAKFTVRYTFRGETSVICSGDFPIGTTRQINVPNGSTGIFLKVEIATFFATYKTVFQGNYPNSAKRCFYVYGYTFAPYFLPVQCDANPEQYLSMIKKQLCYDPCNPPADFCLNMLHKSPCYDPCSYPLI